MGDLFGFKANLVVFFVLMIIIIGFDFIADDFMFRRFQYYNITTAHRVFITLYVMILWVGMEFLFALIDAAISPHYNMADTLYLLTSPHLFLTAALMGIAVWHSLGYGLKREKRREQKSSNNDDPAALYLKARKTGRNIAEDIKREKEKLKDESPEK
jgi:hypothetical protein